jgi:polyisoprenyl-teichoic acid--peptidoglycan teichoic acid transferase
VTNYGSPRPGSDPRRAAGPAGPPPTGYRGAGSSGVYGGASVGPGVYGGGPAGTGTPGSGGTYGNPGSSAGRSGVAGVGARSVSGRGTAQPPRMRTSPDGAYSNGSHPDGMHPGGASSGGGGTGRGSGGGRSGGPGKGRSGPGRPRATKRRSPWWAKVSLILGIAVMLAGLGGMAFTKLLTGQVNGAISQVSLLAQGSGGAKATSIDGSINLLMIGLDTRDNNPKMGSRADSIIIGHIPATHDQVDLISIPRDTYVPIPAYKPSHFAGWSDKINAAFQDGSQNGVGNAGGVQLLQKTIEQNWHITFQAALIVNFDGFSDIVNKIGGVKMYVDETTQSLHHGYVTGHPNEHTPAWTIHTDGTPGHRIPGTTPVIYKKGWHTFNAYDALDYVRCRDFLPNSDYDRQRHQQQFIKALMQQAYAKGISDPLQISSFLKSLGKAFQFDGGGHNTSDWIFTLKGISPGAIRTIKINNGTYNTKMVGNISTQQMSADSIQLLNDVRTDTVDNFLAVHPDWVTTS